MDKAQVIRKLEALLLKSNHMGYRLAYTGRRIDNVTVTMVGAPTNQMFVRYPDESRDYTTVWGRVNGKNAPVWIGPSVEGFEEYKGPAWELGTAIYGDAFITMIQPPVIGELLPQTVSSISIQPGRVEPSRLGALYIHVAAFRHIGGGWVGGSYIGGVLVPTTDDIDLASYVPGTTSYVVWVVIYLDPVTNALGIVAGTPVFGLQSDLLESDIDLIVLPKNVYPLGAVALQNGQTQIDSSTRIVDMRLHLDRNAYSGHLLLVDDIEQDHRARLNFLASKWLVPVAADDPTNDETEIAYTLDPTGVTDIGTPANTDLLLVYDISANEMKSVEAGQLGGGGGGGGGGGARYVPTLLYEDELLSAGSWDVENADLISGVGVFADYDRLEIWADVKASASVTAIFGNLIFNNDTNGSHYLSTRIVGGSSGVSGGSNGADSLGFTMGGSGGGTLSALFSPVHLIIQNPGKTDRYKASVGLASEAVSASVQVNDILTMTWFDTSAIDRLTLNVDNVTTTFVAGSTIRIVGWKVENIGSLPPAWSNVFPTTAVELTDFAWVNQGGAVATQQDDAVFLAVTNSSSENLRILKKAAPATPYSVTTMVSPLPFPGGLTIEVGIGFRESSSSLLHVLRLNFSGASMSISSTKHSNTTAGVAHYVDLAVPFLQMPIWLRIEDDGTNRICSYSADGVNFCPFHSVSRTNYLTADEVLFFVGGNSNTYVGATFHSWSEA